MTKVAERTSFPNIFSQTYWGGFQIDDPNILDAIVLNRNTFAREYQIAQPIKGHGLQSFLRHNSNLWDHIELYRVQTAPESLVLVTSPYGSCDAEDDYALQQGFVRYHPIYSEKASTFVKIFRNRSHLRSFIKQEHEANCNHILQPCECLRDFFQESNYRGMPNAPPVHPRFEGCVLFASPGSGKSRLAEKFDFVVDVDDLLIQEIVECFPDFTVDREEHPGKNLLSFCRVYSRQALEPIYESVREEVEKLVHNCYIAVTGSVALMDMADFVFVQTNGALLRTGYDTTKEREQAMHLGKFIPIDWYLEEVVKYDPDYL